MDFKLTPTVEKYCADPTFIKFLGGAVGLSKTASNIQLIIGQIFNQITGPYGYAETYVAVVRNVYREMETSTLPEFRKWLPENRKAGISYKSGTHPHIDILYDRGDGSVVKATIDFLCVDRPEHLTRLRSTNYTILYMGEAQTLKYDVIPTALMRVGRAPVYGDEWRALGKRNANYFGIIGDFNMEDTSHWIYQRMVADFIPHPKTKEAISTIHYMPPPLTRRRGHWIDQEEARKGAFFHNDYTYWPNPKAERVEFLEGKFDYFARIMGSMADDFEIRKDIMAEWVEIKKGKAVYGDHFDLTKHCSDVEFQHESSDTMILSMDWGLRCAFTIARLNSWGGVDFMMEGYDGEIGLDELMKRHLGPAMTGRFRDIRKWIFIGDPTSARDPITNKRAHLHVRDFLKELGIEVTFIPSSNNFDASYRAVTTLLQREKGLHISRDCKNMKEGFLGGYKWDEDSHGNIKDKPAKPKDSSDNHSHVADCMEYTCIYAVFGERKHATRNRKITSRKPGGSRFRGESPIQFY